MLFKENEEKYFWGLIIYVFFVEAIIFAIFSFADPFYFVIILLSSILLLSLLQDKYHISLCLEKELNIGNNKKSFINLIIFFIICFLSAISIINIFNELYYFLTIINDMFLLLIYNVILDRETIKTYILTSIGLFGTFLALHWTIVATIYSIKYIKVSEEIQDYYFNVAKTKRASRVTFFYIVIVSIIYFLLSLQKKDDYSITNQIIVTLGFTPSEKFIINDSYLIYFMSVVLFFSMMLLYKYINNSLNFINLTNIYYFYNLFCRNIVNYLKLIIIKNNKKNYIKYSNLVSNHIILMYNIIKHDINTNIFAKTFLEAGIRNLGIIQEYWKIKNKIFCNSAWYPLVEQATTITDTMLTGKNKSIQYDNFFMNENFLKLIN